MRFGVVGAAPGADVGGVEPDGGAKGRATLRGEVKGGFVAGSGKVAAEDEDPGAVSVVWAVEDGGGEERVEKEVVGGVFVCESPG